MQSLAMCKSCSYKDDIGLLAENGSYAHIVDNLMANGLGLSLIQVCLQDRYLRTGGQSILISTLRPIICQYFIHVS